MLTHSYCITILFLILPLSCNGKNVTNEIADIRDDDHKILKYIAFTSFTVSLLYGIITNTLMATVLFYVRRSNYYSHSFILITSQLIICNFMSFVPQMVVVMPEMLQTKNNSYGKLF